MTSASLNTAAGSGMRPNLEMKAQATTKSAMPRAMAKMRRNTSLSPPRRRGPNALGTAGAGDVLGPRPEPAPAGVGGDTFRSAEGCATTTRLGSALISSHLHFEATGVLRRVLAIPHDPVHQ